MCIPRAAVSAVSCLVVPAFICIDLLTSRVLKINDDDDDDDLTNSGTVCEIIIIIIIIIRIIIIQCIRSSPRLVLG